MNVLRPGGRRGQLIQRSSELLGVSFGDAMLPLIPMRRVCFDRALMFARCSTGLQHWMGHKSLETTMRYLVPATDVHGKLDEVKIPPPQIANHRALRNRRGGTSAEASRRRKHAHASA